MEQVCYFGVFLLNFWQISLIFTNFDRVTKEVYTNFILWNDSRPIEICNTMNKGVFLNTFKAASNIANIAVNNHRLRTISKYKVEPYHVNT
jgi:hypothetical protein